MEPGLVRPVESMRAQDCSNPLIRTGFLTSQRAAAVMGEMLAAL